MVEKRCTQRPFSFTRSVKWPWHRWQGETAKRSSGQVPRQTHAFSICAPQISWQDHGQTLQWSAHLQRLRALQRHALVGVGGALLAAGAVAQLAAKEGKQSRDGMINQGKACLAGTGGEQLRSCAVRTTVPVLLKLSSPPSPTCSRWSVPT